jgi:hypothetical protein
VLFVEYCPARKELEEKAWFAVDRYSSAALDLLDLVGQKTRSKFLLAHCECFEAKVVVLEARFTLNSHRAEHGC